MRILTLVVPVPDSNVDMTMTRDGRGIEATGLELACSSLSEFAVDPGRRLRDDALPPRPCPNEER